MKVVVAIDSYKGCLTSQEAERAAEKGIRRICPESDVVMLPVSDGGEGWLSACHAVLGGQQIAVEVSDPLGRPVTANFLKNEDTAVIEIAQASGLMLLKADERDPLHATSYGTGQLVAAAIRSGCRRLLVGLGGSAVSDAGQGMIHALDETFKAEGGLQEVARRLHVVIACDVDNPLCGPHGAASVFGPQKGATPEMVVELDRRAMDFARQSACKMGHDCSLQPGAGAAGGLGYAFMQFMHAECRSGVELLLDMADFDRLIERADLVITGEGAADRQTLMGKLPMGILEHAKERNIPVWLLAGRVSDEEKLREAGFAIVKSINPPEQDITQAMIPQVAKENMSRTVCEMIRSSMQNNK